MLKDFLYVIYHYAKRVLYLFLCIIPIDDKLVYVNNFDGKGIGDSAKYIVQALLERDESLKIYWLSEKNNSAEINGFRYVFVNKKSFSSMLTQAKAKVWISNVRMPLYSVKRREQIYINTWHGTIGFKKVENECPGALTKRYIIKAKHDSKMVNYWVSACKEQSENYRKYYWYDGDGILEVGYPRNDILLKNDRDYRNELLKKYELDNCHYILYAPTFRKDYGTKTYDLDYERIIEAFTQKYGGCWKLIVRLHPNIIGVALESVLFTDNVLNGNVYDDVQEIMVLSDCLITDYSSMSFDFMLLRRPVLLYVNDIDEYRKDRDLHMEFEDTRFLMSSDMNGLITLIEELDIEKYVKDIEYMIEQFKFVENEKSSYTIADKILAEI